MCGIAGIFAHGSAAAPVDPVELRVIRDAMESRGPDGKGAWISPDGRLGVGQGRLSFVDLRHLADPPLAADNGRLQIVFNGEIYNYQDLRRELVAEGRQLMTESDTEVVLHLYDRDGPAMLGRLRGMFAIAIWDERSRTLFLARDQFGIKPLYYADDGKTFRFASQVKALLAGGRIDLAPDPAGHVGFFLWGHVPDPHTLYRAVRALPAGTWMTVDANGASAPRAFFDLAKVFADAGPAPATPEARRALLRSALADSVTHHLIADVPVGVFLLLGWIRPRSARWRRKREPKISAR